MTEQDVQKGVEAIEKVARFMERELLSRSSFHLAPCGGCGAPAFQQPCVICGFYPMGNHTGSWSPDVAESHHFLSSVECSGPGGRGGNLATWCAAEMRRTVWGRLPGNADRIHAMIDRGSDLDLPQAEFFWDLVHDGGQVLIRPPVSSAITLGWNAISHIVTTMTSETTRTGPTPSVVEAFKQARTAWVSAAHSEDPTEIREALDALAAACRDLPASGNRSAALDEIERAKDHVLETPVFN